MARVRVLRALVGAAIVALVIGPAVAEPSRPRAEQDSCTVAGVVDGWSLRRLARQTVVVPVEETDVLAVSRQVSSGAGGVLLFGSSAPTDLGSDLDRLSDKAPDGIRPFVMSDEEGGAVQRMPNLVGRIPSARTMGQTMTPRQIRHLAHRVGDRMIGAGVTMDLAPVLDLDDGPGPDADHPIGTRSFSIKVKVATRDGLAFATGLLRAGVVPVVKHFPGLGETSPSTDVAPASTKPWRNLKKHGLRPFATAVSDGVPAVMVSNASVPGLTDQPSSLSRVVTQRVLRHRLGFRGLIITDSLSAGAISGAGFTIRRATVAALRAGADMVLFNAEPGDVGGVMRATVARIVYAVRHDYLSRARLETAVVRILKTKNAPVCG
jgi:beta-N-acetylhexosaminidase